VANVLKVGLVCIVCEVFSKYIYLLAPTCIVAVINFIGKFKYQLSHFQRNELLE
jgi:hypothetical protein